MINSWIIFFLFFIISLNPSIAFSKSIYSSFEKGRELYDKKNYKEALQAFLEAQVENFEDIKLKYNISNAQYKMKNYDEAIKGYLDVARNSKELSLKEKSYYNLGNCFYRQEKLEEAAQCYKKALEFDPNDKDAKYNLELVLDKLKKQMSEQKQTGEKKNEEQMEKPGENKKKGDEKQKDSAGHEKQKGEQEMIPKMGKGEDKSQQEEKAKIATRELSKEEAEMLLNSLKEDQKNFLKGDIIKKNVIPYNPSKDW